MNPRIVKNWVEKPTHIARVLSPKGIYPAESISFPEGLYLADDELCFSLVRHCEPYPEDEIYSELQWLTPSEIITYGALMLGVDRERGYSAVYPYSISLDLECQPGPDPLAWAAEYVKPLLVQEVLAPDVQHPGFVAIAANPYKSSSDIPMPPVAGGPPYQFQERILDYELAQSLFAAMDPEDILVIRGLATYIKAAMLHFHFQFFEEALNTLYISLECSFQMVLSALEQGGKQNPTAKDAANFIHDALHDINRVERYFEEDYERRIISFHPVSRLGNYPYPPMSADDYYDLFSELQEVYQYLLTGYVHPWRLKRAGMTE